jgi:hypothetical protein
LFGGLILEASTIFEGHIMDIRAPWREMMRVLVWAAAAILVMVGSVLISGESDSLYVLLMASPFVFLLSITSLWMAWKRATAREWNGSTSVGENNMMMREGEPPPPGVRWPK